MRLIYKSTFYKVSCVLRFLALKVYYFQKFSAPVTSMIGRRCGIYIQGNGEIRCNGRIIVNNDVTLQALGSLTLGEHFGINSYSRIIAHESIAIGHNVTIGQMVSILDHDHDFSIQNGNMLLNGYKTEPISIGNNVWIGDKSTVLKGVTIGNNVVVGANTLVHKDVPDNCVIGGTPFKILKEL